MDCPTCEAMVEPYLDGELPAGESVRFEAALEACPDCRGKLDRLRGLRSLIRELPAERAPDLMRARLERELRAAIAAAAPLVESASSPTPGSAATPSPRLWSRRSAMAASLLVALGAGWVGGRYTGQDGSRETDELLAGYLRVGLGDRPVDVASSDQHTVKPWFAGRIDYAPPVYDLTSAGFPLLGGRLDVLEGRRIAVLVYRRNQHRLALSLWPATASGDTAPVVSEQDGFAIARWRHAGFELRAIGDIAPKDMSVFAASIDKAMEAGK
ncbi:MAG: anti-sigma factor [Reyranella sp.]|jgi:anti-sigma factor RsiW|uniref:anti-sigma factor family protein n=1 Tax=Reyranella sp. TaxID=1929291 RepID=UPI0025F24CB4|nr:anti-sigma factor [Reyranella sp.]MBR2819528.1 anti-sigma factor [Reyranella sp.]